MATLHSLILSCALLFSGTLFAVEVNDLSQGQEGSLSYPSSVEKVTLIGELAFPKQVAAKYPAMVIAHGSGGLDSRSKRWAYFFQEQGIATLTIDYFRPRGVFQNSRTQPTPVHDAIDALRLLATHPRIDPRRISIIGFSRGGHLAYETANTGAGPNELHYAAHIALYPSCSNLGVRRSGLSAPVLLLLGALDELVPVDQCEILADRIRERSGNVTLKTYQGAYHGWDGDYTMDYFQPSLNRSYRIQADASITAQSRMDVIEFLKPLIGPFPQDGK
jgi:dienelactone hydrolase